MKSPIKVAIIQLSSNDKTEEDSNSNTQNILHPLTTVELGDMDKAKHIAKKLKNDKFYNLCSDTTLKRYDLYYSESKFIENTQRIFSTLVN